MDENQRQSLLRSISISSGVLANPAAVSSQERAGAYQNLEQFKLYPGRIPACIELLTGEQFCVEAGVDLTVPTKLYALGVLQDFLKTGYARCEAHDRLSLRGAVLTAARQLASAASEQNSNNSRILGNKIASLLSDIVVRDFPQRWTTFVSDLYKPVSQGGIWCEAPSGPAMGMVGVKIGLECLKLITEDCTDSDFNAKISTIRRNDVLIGFNEVSSQFLPLFFQLISEQYAIVSAAKSSLHEMVSYLVSNGRSLPQMSPEERSMYQAQIQRRDAAGQLVADVLVTLEKMCQSMPLDWMLAVERTGCDFVAAMLHLLREDVAGIQELAVACLQQLAMRKLEFVDWMRFIASLPSAISEANQVATQQESERAAAMAVGAGGGSGGLTEQLSFHRGLSKMLSTLLSAHLAFISTDKEIVSGQGQGFQHLSTYLHFLAEMLSHPSGRICGEQLNTWIGMLRDPQIVRTKILSPYMEQLLTSYMHHIRRVRWEDVDNQTHAFTSVMEASFDDEEEYNLFHGELRSKASQLFKYISNTEPKLASTIIHAQIKMLLNSHGNGEPYDHLDPATKQLTPQSEAVLAFEGLNQPLDNILQGLPSWALKEVASRPVKQHLDAQRAQIRASVRSLLSEIANMIVSWNPTYIWLKFRRTTLLDALKYYWAYDPSTLASGVDALLVYLIAEDEVSSGTFGSTLSGDVIGLRKKSGLTLVSVSKTVPHHLVPWLAQLSDRAKTLLSSGNLLPPNQMHLYEFLSCVATAVEDTTARANFISDVLSNALNVLDSAEVKETLSSVEGLIQSFGIAQAGTNPESVRDPTNVKRISARFVSMFSAFNQLLSVGKRCSEASRKRRNQGIPLQNVSPSANFGDSPQNFPDEGPVSISDIAVNDPFVPLWPRILPTLMQAIDVTLRFWHPEYQALLLSNPIQCYAYAISDDEAYLATKQDGKGGVFGEGGTAGSVVSGCDRRDVNLVPKWSGWFNELRTTCFQMLGLLSAQRVLYAPEMSSLFPQLVSVIVDPTHLRAMEHRHFSQYLKQFVELLLLTCPCTLYRSHLAPILGPIFEHMQYRLKMTWSPIISPNTGQSVSTGALTSANRASAVALASSGGESWFEQYYARGGLFVGDLDSVTAESAVEKVRVDLGRTISDMMQVALALKGEWALVLANQAKQEQLAKRPDYTKSTGPITRLSHDGPVNADGTPRGNDAGVEARKRLRIHEMCKFLLLDDERVAGYLTLSIIQCLEYPDAYTCRRVTRICHRILETVAWNQRYTVLLGNHMFTIATKNIVAEPKWMVGIEWDMINVLRDTYGRLCLGQTFLPGGQGPAMQQVRDPNNSNAYEQSKNADKPLLGGGLLVNPSDGPREILANLPGITVDMVKELDASLVAKRSAKDQKDVLRDLLRVAAENAKESEDQLNTGILGRAVAAESLLNQKKSASVQALPEKLVTQSMIIKQQNSHKTDILKADGSTASLGQLFSLS
eukprot:CAMPEP_0198290488 /NCGR_PEP_ID=MMETSP1449-20131203/8336_1 /TAXON_ID=420275 /ORGANISM="Attheya septentrionalis, Strain CCMP2084" /LENGTH=1467 /DNA_ID=CAMNT_0043988997 /DNA_START=193 /DNA_END=4596 /DNA_ORIENTATION=+